MIVPADYQTWIQNRVSGLTYNTYMYTYKYSIKIHRSKIKRREDCVATEQTENNINITIYLIGLQISFVVHTSGP